MNDITILINSCDAFSDMWENIISLYDKYWPNHPDLYILSDKKTNFDYSKIIETNGEMSNRLLDALNHIKTKYVFLSFDDYYPKKNVNSETIQKVVELMESNGVDYCRIFNKVKIHGKSVGELKYKGLPLKSIYEVNFYPSLWNVDSLKKIIKPNEEIWKAEARLTRRFKDANLKGITISNKGVFDFVDVVRKGKYLRSAYRFLKRNKLFISSRKKRTIMETIRLNTRIFIADHFPVFKNLLKKIAHKRGKVYYSDYELTDD